MAILLICGIVALMLGKFWKFVGWVAVGAVGLFVFAGACVMS